MIFSVVFSVIFGVVFGIRVNVGFGMGFGMGFDVDFGILADVRLTWGSTGSQRRVFDMGFNVVLRRRVLNVGVDGVLNLTCEDGLMTVRRMTELGTSS